MKTYHVKEMFGPTLQGEGMHSGRSCVFVRLSGCNAWNGKPETRAASACPYCDTDFFGGQAYDCDEIIATLTTLAADAPDMGCVLTGGEPLLQADVFLLDALGAAFAWVDIETNGTQLCPQRPANVFVSCSPKRIAHCDIMVTPDWWKILIPAQESFLEQACASDAPVFVQPVCPGDGTDVSSSTYQENLRRCVQLCYTKGVRMSVQLHKYLHLQ